MNRIQGYSNIDFSKREAGPVPEPSGRCRLRARGRKLRRLLSACKLEGLRANAYRIEAAAESAAAVNTKDLPGAGSVPRVLILARRIVRQGEVRLDAEKIEAEIAAFDALHPLEMNEFFAMPDALRIALCEGFLAAAELLERIESAQAAARRWIARGGRGDMRSACDEAFFEHALRLCMRGEDDELRRRLTHAIAECGQRAEWIVERAHRIEADCAMRMENLLHLARLLELPDWDKRMERISPAEAELNADAVYARSDDATKAMTRAEAALLARRLGEKEIVVIRRALQLCAAEKTETACAYFLDDSGRRRLCASFGSRRHLPKRIPDPNGWFASDILLALTAAITALAAAFSGGFAWVFCAISPAWTAAERIAARFSPRFLRPMRLPKLKLEAIPNDARTLVALPVLLGDARRAAEAVERLETLGCLESDANVDFLLLGDFRDAEQENLPEDAEILTALDRGVSALNRRAPREKYFYLMRGRTYRAQDARWMGENRKHGAILALNRYLLGGEAAFAAGGLPRRDYRYVVTLDADTEYLPGTVQKLVGAMLHPLNARYAVLQPDMRLTADACGHRFAETLYGAGGVDAYPTAVSGYFQDFSGIGSFSGKGIYEVERFARATDGTLPDAELLSHDLIEGVLAGTGNLCDVCFYDGCPQTLPAELLRAHRWTRGDWQLTRTLFRVRMRAADRVRIIGNLLRSLNAPALLIWMLLAAWLNAPAAFVFALALNYLEPLLHPLKRGAWQRATLELAILPVRARFALDAALRSLWRLWVSHRHLMDWVPSADAVGDGLRPRLWGRLAAILVLPALLYPAWIPAAAALAALFWISVDWADDLAKARTDAAEPLSGSQAARLNALAQRTWHFFEAFVPEDGNGLPPDNVQIDPPVGAAKRTSPTNIGLYLMSCLAARNLGYIGTETMLRRMDSCAKTLESLEKWNGQLYNWYDTETLAPLRPRYVSSVDGGNLAASLMLCARAAEDPALAARLRALAENMDFRALYDPERELFFIGFDAENGALSRAHYDLYASESRILSFAAMMLKQAPPKHWRRLSRAETRVGKQRALLSWSGTLFEYLMPELILSAPEKSLAGRTRRAVVTLQRAQGRRTDRPWGVSESGYCAFDLNLNYQYRAFGLRPLALSEAARADVVAPYASALALCVEPGAAAENLARMEEMGWTDESGFFEAADYRDGGEAKLVRSHMAHHQGMLLCAACNALTAGSMQRTFMEIPQARALRLLLHEKTGESVRRRRTPPRKIQTRREPSLAHAPACVGEIHLLHGGGTTVLATARGGVFARRDDLLLNRFSGDLTAADEGLYVHLNGVPICLRAEFAPGSACWRAESGEISTKLTAVVSPENGVLFEIVDLENRGNAPRSAEIAACTPVALAREAEMRAHPVFQNLFVESSRADEKTLAFRRRSRSGQDVLPKLYFTCSEPAECETDLEKLVGRTGAVGAVNGIAEAFSGTTGCTLNPCAALKTTVRLAAGERRRLCFALGVENISADSEFAVRTAPSSTVETLSAAVSADPALAVRAAQLARAQARALMEFSFDAPETVRLCHRAAALLFDAKLRPQIDGAASVPADVESLWRTGISGTLPIIAVEIETAEEADSTRAALRMREYFDLMGVRTDFALIVSDGGDYRRSVYESLRELSDGENRVRIVDASDARARAAVLRAAAIRLNGKKELREQLRMLTDALRIPESCAYVPMRGEEMPVPRLEKYNYFGGFDGESYVILLKKDRLPPAPWSNILASEEAGALMTDRGGGFAWRGSSRSGRLTPFRNDALREGWGWMFYLADHERRRWMRLLPGDAPMTDFLVRFAPDACSWRGRAAEFEFEVRARASANGVRFEIELRNASERKTEAELIGFADWLMGTDAADAAQLRVWSQAGACFAAGAANGIGCFLSDSISAQTGCTRREFLAGGDVMSPGGFDRLNRPDGGWTLRVPVRLHARETKIFRFALEGFDDAESALMRLRAFRNGEVGEAFASASENLKLETPDEALNAFANAFLPAQNLNARIRARTGLHQPGGAFGFRDQLQDMLPLIYTDPRRVRRHILTCAARQFAAGDVLHWWHPPYTGVRTRIRDDLLFLPYVTAKYVAVTEDRSILTETVPFLEDAQIPPDAADLYAEMRPSETMGTLNEHCMRALRYAAETGRNGLCMMGGGDWNDGMNRVGGESVWLTEFLAVCAADYARIALNADDRAWLTALNESLTAALETFAWDGGRYLRAIAADGTPIGGEACAECRIDAISQAWAVFAGLDETRCKAALDTAWRCLADEDAGLIRLLDPPFSGEDFDPGYIAAYPPGVRENGGQYTHAACWLLIALIRAGDERRAHRALEMLLPYNHPAEIYRGEPYVMAADVCADALHMGRAGWMWYTGSAAWMRMALFELLGFERRGSRVRVRAMLGGWREAGVRLKYGDSVYRLISRKNARGITLDGESMAGEWITLIDDGAAHEAVFPARNKRKALAEAPTPEKTVNRSGGL